jgi:hypothetical protein
MPSTGFTPAGTGANVDTGQASWSNPGNITADDGTEASSSLGSKSPGTTDISDYLQATNFGFTLPAGAVPVGVEVRVQKRNSNIVDRVISLVVGGSVVGDNNADLVTPWPGSATNVDYGGATDLWGLSLSKAQVEASNFGVVVQAQLTGGGNASASVDAIWINVHYIIAGGNRGYIIG